MQKLFVRPHTRSLDAKGRLVLPLDYREGLTTISKEGRFWLTAFYGHLTAYLPEQWEAMADRLYSVRNPSMKFSHYISKILGLSQEMTPDSMGRIRIPQPLIREAGLTKEVILIGKAEKFEIWDADRFYNMQEPDVSEEIAAIGLDIGF